MAKKPAKPRTRKSAKKVAAKTPAASRRPRAANAGKPDKNVPTPAPDNKGGNGSEYSDEAILAVLERMALGQTLSSICAEEGQPSRTSIWRWKERNEANRNTYARVRVDQMHAWADDIVDISDDGTNDWEERSTARGETYIALNPESVHRSKLRCDNRKWLMARLAAKDYGDRAALDVTVTTPISKAIEEGRKRAAGRTGGPHASRAE
jgi:hypothetical protein